MHAALLVPLVLTAGFGGAFAVNEASQGWLAEAMGAGHHHATSMDWHCQAGHGPAEEDHVPCHEHPWNASSHVHDHAHGGPGAP